MKKELIINKEQYIVTMNKYGSVKIKTKDTRYSDDEYEFNMDDRKKSGGWFISGNDIYTIDLAISQSTLKRLAVIEYVYQNILERMKTLKFFITDYVKSANGLTYSTNETKTMIFDNEILNKVKDKFIEMDSKDQSEIELIKYTVRVMESEYVQTLKL